MDKPSEKDGEPIANNGKKPPHKIQRGFQKGISGNPSGRPKGQVEKIRQLTSDGRLITDFLVAVVGGGIEGTCRDRIDAAKYLYERMYGKTPETVLTGQLEENAVSMLAELSLEQLQTLAAARTTEQPQKPAQPSPVTELKPTGS